MVSWNFSATGDKMKRLNANGDEKYLGISNSIVYSSSNQEGMNFHGVFLIGDNFWPIFLATTSRYMIQERRG